jgi:hypothetical protein
LQSFSATCVLLYWYFIWLFVWSCFMHLIIVWWGFIYLDYFIQ